MRVTLKLKRFNPEVDEKQHWEEYQIDVEPNDQLLDALNKVKWFHDGTLTYRRSCAHGVCGSDAMVINGRNRLACKVLMKDLGNKVTVEPIRGLPVVKDMVVDMEPFFAKFRAMKPFLINNTPAPDGRERHQTVEDRERFDDTTKCILCACCTTSCPSFWANGEYIGPASIVQIHRFIFDTRDEATKERLEIANDAMGVWRCRTVFNCVEACPREINITKAIGEVKKAILEG
ncbi:MAG: succinate dehydrogenase iron-sulfur subunit [Caldilineales bacterium]